MSSALVCAQPATSLPGLLIPEDKPAFVLKHLSGIPHLSRVRPAVHLEVQPAPAIVSSGLGELDALAGGLPRGCLTEIFGPASSGRSSALTAVLAAATRRQEACALVDVSDAFDPQSAAAAGVEFKNLLWVRCDSQSRRDDDKPSRGRFHKGSFKTELACVEQALKVTDLILQSGGFGLVAIDLADIPLPAARRIPLTSWFRFRRAVENTPTVLLVIGQGPCAGTCTSLLLQLEGQAFVRSRGELSVLSSQLSEKESNDERRTVAIHNFPTSQSAWALQQGRAVPDGKKNCQGVNQEKSAGGTAPEGRRDLSPALQRWDKVTERVSPGRTTDVCTHPIQSLTTHAEATSAAEAALLSSRSHAGLKPCSTQNTLSSEIRAGGGEESKTEDSVPAHARLLNGISIRAELLRSRLGRMPAQSARTRVETKSWHR